MAVRLFARESWESRLRAEGCQPRLDAAGTVIRLKTAELWATASDKTFPVAVDQSGYVRDHDLQMALVLIAQLRPIDIE